MLYILHPQVFSVALTSFAYSRNRSKYTLYKATPKQVTFFFSKHASYTSYPDRSFHAFKSILAVY